jgi:L-2-hydroxycarboxylate dehydrogenase (NAD+)
MFVWTENGPENRFGRTDSARGLPQINTNHRSSVHISVGALTEFIACALERAGLPQRDARATAALMSHADQQGSDGHGVLRLPQYVRRIRAGGINTRPDIRVLHETAGTALVDGDNGMGHLVVSFATRLAMTKAAAAGAAWVGTRNSNHAGPASLYARMPLERDMVSLYFAVGNANHLPPWGGMTMLLSTNPIAVGIPASGEPPIVLDMATTVAAYGKVKAKAKRGEPMPEGWMIDRSGRPLTDPKRADEGFVLPIGGYKGYGLALIIGLLAGTLNGAAMGKEVIDFNKDHTTRTNTGQSILVIDLHAFGEAETFKAAVAQVIRDLRTSERLPGIERIWLPGEQSHLKRERYGREGVPIPAELIEELQTLANELGIERLESPTYRRPPDTDGKAQI